MLAETTILRIESARLREALNNEDDKKRDKLQQEREWHERAMWWSKRKSLEPGCFQDTSERTKMEGPRKSNRRKPEATAKPYDASSEAAKIPSADPIVTTRRGRLIILPIKHRQDNAIMVGSISRG